MPYIFGKLWHLAIIWAIRKAFQCILQSVRILLANHTRISPTSENDSYIIWCVPPSTWWWKEVHPPPPHAHYTWAASTPPTPSQCGPSRQSVTKSRRPGQLSGPSGPSPVFPTFPTPVIWATRGYWTCFFCQENRSPPKLILTMKLKDSTAWYCDVWYQVLCDVEYCKRILNIKGCVWYWSIFSHNFHLWNRIRLITLNQ